MWLLQLVSLQPCLLAVLLLALVWLLQLAALQSCLLAVLLLPVRRVLLLVLRRL